MLRIISTILLVFQGFNSISQTTNDTILVIKNPKELQNLRKIIKDNENGKVAMRELEITKHSLDTAKLALNVKDTLLSVMKEKDDTRIHQLQSYEQAIALLQKQTEYATSQIEIINKQRIQEKRKKIVFQITTILAALATGYFAVIK